jgi:protein-tyrosine phosphatase
MAQIVATQLAQRSGLSQRVRFESAGTHAGKIKMQMDSRAIAALKKRGYVVGKMRSRPVEDKDFQRFDLILAMDSANFTELQRVCPPEHRHKLQMFLATCKGLGADEVPDPYYGNSAGFERVLDLCEAGAQGLLNSNMA